GVALQCHDLGHHPGRRLRPGGRQGRRSVVLQLSGAAPRSGRLTGRDDPSAPRRDLGYRRHRVHRLAVRHRPGLRCHRPPERGKGGHPGSLHCGGGGRRDDPSGSPARGRRGRRWGHGDGRRNRSGAAGM
ncbi:uncharacterized protein METZ01_LOCUS48698, partial [marine metagenome]